MNFFVNHAMGLGNSGVEHAEFYRAKRLDDAGIPYRFIFLDVITELHRAMDRWGLAEDHVINVWEYLVLGKKYLHEGVTKRLEEKTESVTDSTNTIRKRDIITDSGMRIVYHYVKRRDIHHPESDILMVANARTEIFDARTNERKVMYEEVDDVNRGIDYLNIHLFNEDGKHLFFENRTQLFRYFFEVLDREFGGHSNFMIDRGEHVDQGLMTNRIPDSKIIYMVHADHMADRDDPKYPLWNDHYEYMFDHMDKVDRVVVATDLQRDDILVDYPDAGDKVVTIPVGGVRDEHELNTEKKLGNPIRLITASRLAGEKHIDVLAEAVIQMRKEGKDFSLDIYGAGEMQANLNKLIEENDAGEYIRLMGMSDKLEELYPKYDAYVSGSFSEGFGLTYIEALDAGLPIITFKARFGALEIVQDGVNGFLQDFKREDGGDETAHDFNVKSFIAGLQRFLDADYAELKKQTVESIAKYRDSEITHKWEELLNEL